MRTAGILRIIMATLGSVMLLAVFSNATDDPHGTLNSINCQQCHVAHGTVGDILVNSPDSLVSALCISCHTPGGWQNMSKTLSSSQRAIPGVSGTSHAWNVDTLNASRGAGSPRSGALLGQLGEIGAVGIELRGGGETEAARASTGEFLRQHPCGIPDLEVEGLTVLVTRAGQLDVLFEGGTGSLACEGLARDHAEARLTTSARHGDASFPASLTLAASHPGVGFPQQLAGQRPTPTGHDVKQPDQGAHHHP